MKFNFFLKKSTAAKTAEYRKNIRKYDVFTFFNELELLEIRLNILEPHVDYFVMKPGGQEGYWIWLPKP